MADPFGSLGKYMDITEIQVAMPGLQPENGPQLSVGLRVAECNWTVDSDETRHCRFSADHRIHLFRGRSLKLSMVVRKLSSLAVFRDMLAKSPILDQPFAFEANYSEIAKDSVNDQSDLWYYQRVEELAGIRRHVTITIRFNFRQFTMTGVQLPSAPEDSIINPKDIIDIVHGIQTTLGAMGENFETALDIVGVVGGVLGEVHPIASLVVAAMSIPIKYYKKKIEFKESLQKLAVEAHRLLQHLGELELDDIPSNDFDILKSAIIAIMEAIVEAGDFVECYMARGNIGKTMTSHFSEAIQDLLEVFRRCRDDYQLALSQKTHQSQRQKIVKEQMEELRDWLRLVKQEPLEEECMEGTRERILSDIDEWLDDPVRSLVWISGAPGIGKSTIVSSIIQQRTRKGDQVITFCFKRRTEPPEPLRDPGMLWPSLAFDLAQRFRDCRLALIEAKKANPFGIAGVTKQFKMLVQGPIKNNLGVLYARPGKLLVVIDGVDEAIRDPPLWAELLDTLRDFDQLSKESGGQIHVVISSRSLHDISDALLPLRPSRIALSVADPHSNDSEIWRDLHHFFTTRLRAGVSAARSRKWPRDQELKKLTELANGLFIWADNAVKYILRPDGDKQKRLDFVLKHGYPGEDNIDTPSSMDICYSRVFQDAVRNKRDDEKQLLRSFTRAVIVSQASLSMEDLVKLGVLPHEIKLSDLRTRLGCLLPFVEAVDSMHHFRAFHDSFRIFLVSERAQVYRFNESEENARQALYCLRWMNNSGTLYFNLCSIPSSYNAINVAHPSMVSDKISPLLAYTCRFWARHLAKATFIKSPPDAIKKICKDVVTQLDVFFHWHFLHWLEVMSFLRSSDTVPEMIEICLSWLNKLPSPNQKLVKFVEDGYTFASEFAHPIARSIPHIYVSCLPFTSQESEIYKTFSSTFSNVLRVPSLPERVATRTHRSVQDIPVARNECIIALAFSPDGKSILSASADCKSSLWNSRSGALRRQASLCGDDIFATIASYSPDQEYIALGCIGKANSIRVYRFLQGPQQVANVELVSQKVIKCLVFFPPGSRKHLLACGYYEQEGGTGEDHYAWSIRILDYKTGKTTTPAIRCSCAKPLSSLTISRDSRYIMACSADSITSFTPDSDNRLFYQHCSTDAFRVWDAHTGKAITKPFTALFEATEPMARDLTIAPPIGRRTSSLQAPVYVTGASFKEKIPLQSAPYDLVSTAHSVRKKLIASGGQNNTIYVWNAETGVLILTLIMKSSGEHRCLAFSKDGAFIAAGSGKGDIAVWAVPEGNDTARSHSMVLPKLTISRPATLEVGNGQGGGASGTSSARRSRHPSLSRGSRSPSPSPHSQASSSLDGKGRVWYHDTVYIDFSGWVRDKSETLLFWVPPEYRDGIQLPDAMTSNSGGSNKIRIDFSKFMHGKYWTECRTPQI